MDTDLMKASIVIFGCGGHSRSVVDVLLSYQPDISLVFVDENAKKGEKLYGFDVVAEMDLNAHPYFFSIGDNEKRRKKFEEIGPSGLISILSLKAHFGRESKISLGVFVGNFAHVGPEASIGENTIINNGCIIEHEVKIGRHCHIGPRAVISGRCKIGDEVFVGVGAVIKDSISVCSNVVIGAGAVIVKDIVEPGVYVGVPGKMKSSSTLSDSLVAVL